MQLKTWNPNRERWWRQFAKDSVVSEEPEEINTVWINVNKCIEMTVIYVIFFIIGCIVTDFGITNVIQNIVHTIQPFIVSSHVLPISPAFDNPKCSQLSVQVIADIDSESEILVF